MFMFILTIVLFALIGLYMWANKPAPKVTPPTTPAPVTRLRPSDITIPRMITAVVHADDLQSMLLDIRRMSGYVVSSAPTGGNTYTIHYRMDVKAAA